MRNNIYIQADYFGELLKAYRVKNNIKVAEWGEIFGLSARQIVNYECNEINAIPLKMMLIANEKLGFDFFQGLLLLDLYISVLPLDWALLNVDVLLYKGHVVDKQLLIAQLSKNNYHIVQKEFQNIGFHTFVKEQRTKRHLTQTDVGKAMGSSYQTVNRIERNIYANTTPHMVVSVVNAMALDFFEALYQVDPHLTSIELDAALRISPNVTLSDTKINYTKVRQIIQKTIIK